MNDQQLAELESEAARLWAVCNQTQEADKKATAEWHTVHQAIRHEKYRREVMAEIVAETKGQAA